MSFPGVCCFLPANPIPDRPWHPPRCANRTIQFIRKNRPDCTFLLAGQFCPFSQPILFTTHVRAAFGKPPGIRNEKAARAFGPTRQAKDWQTRVRSKGKLRGENDEKDDPQQDHSKEARHRERIARHHQELRRKIREQEADSPQRRARTKARFETEHGRPNRGNGRSSAVRPPGEVRTGGRGATQARAPRKGHSTSADRSDHLRTRLLRR